MSRCFTGNAGAADRLHSDGLRELTGAPIIEDGAWLGPHAVVVGPVRIGAGSRVLAGSVVTDNVPPASMVAGNPARVVRTPCPRIRQTPAIRSAGLNFCALRDKKYRKRHFVTAKRLPYPPPARLQKARSPSPIGRFRR
jgi:hypothetical protein